jgi:hypothetical protein
MIVCGWECLKGKAGYDISKTADTHKGADRSPLCCGLTAAARFERVWTPGGGRWLVLREAYFRSVASLMLPSLNVAVGFAFMGVIAGKFVASICGSGSLPALARLTYTRR